MPSVAEKQDFEKHPKSKNKQAKNSDIVDSLDKILLKPRNFVYSLRELFGVGFRTLAVGNILSESWLAALHQTPKSS